MRRNTIITLVFVLAAMVAIAVSCVSSKVTGKSGNQLWSENCQRCHNTPPSSAFTNTQWDVINSHMRLRAMLTDEEAKKIVDFLKTGD